MFTLSKAAGARVPDEIKLSVAYGIVDMGQAVELDGTVAVSGSPVAGVVSSQYDAPGGLSSATFSPTFPKGPDSGDVEALVLPATGTVLFDADVIGTTSAAIVVGYLADIAVGGLGISTASTNDDFRVLEILETDDDDYATKVRGVFMNPGYFSA